MPEWDLWGEAARRAAVVALAVLLLANAGLGWAVWRDRRRQRDEGRTPRLPLPGEEDERRLRRRMRPPRTNLWHRTKTRERSRHG